MGTPSWGEFDELDSRCEMTGTAYYRANCPGLLAQVAEGDPWKAVRVTEFSWRRSWLVLPSWDRLHYVPEIEWDMWQGERQPFGDGPDRLRPGRPALHCWLG